VELRNGIILDGEIFAPLAMEYQRQSSNTIWHKTRIIFGTATHLPLQE
jgi:hypothetical protein